MIEKIRPDHVCWLVSVHEWHVAVHQNQVVSAFLVIVQNDILLDFLKSLNSIRGWVYYVARPTEFDRILEDDNGSIDIEALIIYN